MYKFRFIDLVLFLMIPIIVSDIKEGYYLSSLANTCLAFVAATTRLRQIKK